MRTFNVLLVAFFLCVSCADKHDMAGHGALIGIGDQYLYADEVESMLPVGLSSEDSTHFVDRYVRNWLEDVLLYERAKDNVDGTEEVDKLVENYRKSLIMHKYQQELLQQRFAEDVSEDELSDYYSRNRDAFKVERPLIKGLFIKVPLTAPGVSEVRRWYRSGEQSAVEKLEKYSLQNAVRYEYFYDEWKPAADVFGMMPQPMEQSEAGMVKQKHVEVKDTAFYYFLNITDYLSVGEQEPYEVARSRVKEMLLNMRQVKFMDEVKDDLYRQALRKHRINYYLYKQKE